MRMLLLESDLDPTEGIAFDSALAYERFTAEWLTEKRSKLAAKTVQRRLTSVRRFAKYAGLGQVLEDYKLPLSAPPMPHPLPEGIDGVRRLLQATRRADLRAAVALCGLAGLRVSEAKAVRPSHYSHQSAMLAVFGKGGKTRYVPISPEAWSNCVEAFTIAFVNDDDLVIPIEDRALRSLITRLGARVKLQRPIASHDLRATFATAIYDKTKDINLVRSLLGHSSVETTQVYIGVDAEKMNTAVQL